MATESSELAGDFPGQSRSQRRLGDCGGKDESCSEGWGKEGGKVFLRLNLFLMLCEHSFVALKG